MKLKKETISRKESPWSAHKISMQALPKRQSFLLSAGKVKGEKENARIKEMIWPDFYQKRGSPMDEEDYMREIRRYELIESDYKHLRKMLPVWKEAHMKKLIGEYMEILESGKRPGEKFRMLYKRLKNDKRNTGVCAVDLSRSHMLILLDELRADGVIHEKDMEGFSQDLQDWMRYGYVLPDQLREIRKGKSAGEPEWTRWKEYEEEER